MSCDGLCSSRRWCSHLPSRLVVGSAVAVLEAVLARHRDRHRDCLGKVTTSVVCGARPMGYCSHSGALNPRGVVVCVCVCMWEGVLCVCVRGWECIISLG